MKKAIYLILAMAFVMPAAIHAEKKKTKSSLIIREEKPKKPKTPRTPIKLSWFGNLNLSMMQTSYDNFWDDYEHPDGKWKPTLSIEGGFTSQFRPSNPSEFYWGAKIGLGLFRGGFDGFETGNRFYPYTNGKKYDDFNYKKFNAYIGPIIGYKHKLGSSNTALDIHFSPQFLLSFGDDFGDAYFQYRDYDGDVKTNREWVAGSIPNAAFEGGVGLWFGQVNVNLNYKKGLSIDGNIDVTGYNILSLGVGVAF